MFICMYIVHYLHLTQHTVYVCYVMVHKQTKGGGRVCCLQQSHERRPYAWYTELLTLAKVLRSQRHDIADCIGRKKQFMTDYSRRQLAAARSAIHD